MHTNRSLWLATPIMLAAGMLVHCGGDSGETSHGADVGHTSEADDTSDTDDTSSSEETGPTGPTDSGAVGDPCVDEDDCGAGLSCIDGACQSDTPGDPEWANWPMPNPASAGLPNPSSYTVNADTVVDNVTLLEWQRVVPADQYNLAGALDYCHDLTLGGKHDWRLPSLVELFSLVDFTVATPAIDAEAFPDTPHGFVVATRIEGSSIFVWSLGFSGGGGTTNASATDTALAVRCVRPAAAPAPAEHYTIASPGEIPGGTVTDNATGLIWQREPAAESFTWQDAPAHCEGLGPNWRVPSFKELFTLVDVRRASPSPLIDPTAFPNTPAESFWTSSVESGTNFAKHVDFAQGGAGGQLATNALRVRCVQ